MNGLCESDDLRSHARAHVDRRTLEDDWSRLRKRFSPHAGRCIRGEAPYERDRLASSVLPPA